MIRYFRKEDSAGEGRAPLDPLGDSFCPSVLFSHENDLLPLKALERFRDEKTLRRVLLTFLLLRWDKP